MNVNLLIDAIVRQTMVLVAQLATSAGLRAPLSHTANQVFLDLVRELKEQGLGNKVIADMFGLALSTYHSKIRRLSESQSYRGQSLWEATLTFIQEKGTVLQAAVLLRFRHDDDAVVRGVLSDLVESGLVFRSGRGDRTTLRAAKPEEMSLADSTGDEGTVASLVWLVVHRQGPATLAQIAESVPADETTLQSAVHRLVADGRITRSEKKGTPRYAADSCVIPIGDEIGWEAAVFDHYQAMVTAICAKLGRGRKRAAADDIIGGSTYGFTVWDGHPHEQEVLGFLSRMRGEAVSLREKVQGYNKAHVTPEGGGIGVIAYVGQTVLSPESAEEER